MSLASKQIVAKLSLVEYYQKFSPWSLVGYRYYGNKVFLVWATVESCIHLIIIYSSNISQFIVTETKCPRESILKVYLCHCSHHHRLYSLGPFALPGAFWYLVVGEHGRGAWSTPSGSGKQRTTGRDFKDTAMVTEFPDKKAHLLMISLLPASIIVEDLSLLYRDLWRTFRIQAIVLEIPKKVVGNLSHSLHRFMSGHMPLSRFYRQKNQISFAFILHKFWQKFLCLHSLSLFSYTRTSWKFHST